MMTTIEAAIGSAVARIVADSVSPGGHRLTTVQVRYPRIIHAEVKTHRKISRNPETVLIEGDVSILDDRSLSRNARSSRAVPVQRLLSEVDETPYMPAFARNQPGMQAGEPLDRIAGVKAECVWQDAAGAAVRAARELLALGVHKQWANRLLEPFGFIDVVMSATDWENFFSLRCHSAAQPEMQDLANAIRLVRERSRPNKLNPGEWHLPYVDQLEEYIAVINFLADNQSLVLTPLEVMKRLSVVRCARVSYRPHNGEPGSVATDLDRYDSLVNSSPVHASPAEHQATPDTRHDLLAGEWSNADLHGNLTGWVQLRKCLRGEYVPG